MNNNSSQSRIVPRQFKKIANPHIRMHQSGRENEANSRPRHSVPESENSKKDEENMMNEAKEKSRALENKIKLEDKNSFAKDLLKNGYIDSYVDYFYIASRKTPDLKSKYERDHDISVEGIAARSLTAHYEIKMLNSIHLLLRNAEENLLKGSISKAIEMYMDVKDKTFYNQDRDFYGSIYFVEKCINLAKNYNQIELLIKAFIAMGNCFDNIESEKGSLLSMNFKEQAKKLFKELKRNDHELEASIYDSLIHLYKELATQCKNQNNYSKAIGYLHNQLDNISNLIEIIPFLKKRDEKESQEQKIEIYLEMANLNYGMEDYPATLETLSNLDLKIGDEQDLNTNFKIRTFFLYSSTYEEMGEYEKAVEYLYEIEKIDSSMQASADNIYAKSLRNLGRLHFRQGNLESSHKNFNKFFKKAKNIDNKELLDIARVNLGMIIGTQGMESYVKMIKEDDYRDFLGSKLKYFEKTN